MGHAIRVLPPDVLKKGWDIYTSLCTDTTTVQSFLATRKAGLQGILHNLEDQL